MSKGDRAAVDVEGLVADAEIVSTGQRLAREGFVQFDHIDGRHLEFRAQQCFLRRADRTDAHDVRRTAGDGHAHDAGERVRPCLTA